MKIFGIETPRFVGNKTITGSLTIGQDAVLNRDAANILALRNSTTPQSFRVYNTWPDGTNNEYGTFDWTSTANNLTIGALAAGTGTLRGVVIRGGSILFRINATNAWQVSGSANFIAVTDNLYDIGLSGASRPRDIHNSRNHLIDVAAVGTSGVGVLGIGNGTEPSTSPADMVQMYSIDIAAGRATLGLRTEEAVAVNAAFVVTHELAIRLNGVNYAMPLRTI